MKTPYVIISVDDGQIEIKNPDQPATERRFLKGKDIEDVLGLYRPGDAIDVELNGAIVVAIHHAGIRNQLPAVFGGFTYPNRLITKPAR
jgi:hypothetical protein